MAIYRLETSSHVIPIDVIVALLIPFDNFSSRLSCPAFGNSFPWSYRLIQWVLFEKPLYVPPHGLRIFVLVSLRISFDPHIGPLSTFQIIPYAFLKRFGQFLFFQRPSLKIEDELVSFSVKSTSLCGPMHFVTNPVTVFR